MDPNEHIYKVNNTQRWVRSFKVTYKAEIDTEDVPMEVEFSLELGKEYKKAKGEDNARKRNTNVVRPMLKFPRNPARWSS